MKLTVLRALPIVYLLMTLTGCDGSDKTATPALAPEPAIMNQPAKPVSNNDTPEPNDGDAVIIPHEIKPAEPPQPVPDKTVKPAPEKTVKPMEPPKPSRPVVPAFARQSTTDNTLYLRFSATGESFYTEITLENGILSYTYFLDEEKRCEKWVKSTPCWRESDLKTISMALPDADLDNLYTLARESGIFKIKSDKAGSAKPGQRYYSQQMEVRIDGKIKKLTYQSFPGATQKPEAFSMLETALVEYARDLPH